MIRYRLFFNFDKEEQWLTEMGRQGWELTRVDFAYHFRPVEPHDAPIRIDFRTFTSQDDYVNYLTLFEDSGWKHIAGGRSLGAQYFKRISPDSSEDIFSDGLSRAERYRRYSYVWFSLSIVFLMLLAVLWSTGAIDLSALIQPRRLYLTPGLWERSGAAFWRAFWFETPFALLRAGSMCSFPLFVAFYLFFAINSQRMYNKEKQHDLAE
jgi:hypothetical protein